MLDRLFRLPAALLGLAAGLLAGPVLAAEPVFPASSSIGLVPPPGMSPAKGFSGFEHRSGASIVLVEMPPEAYPQVAAKFTPEGLAATGFSAKGAGEALPVSGGEARVMRGSQTANGLAYDKWVVLLKGGPGTGLVTVQVPQKAAAQVPAAAVEAALRTIAYRAPVAIDDQIAALPYAVGETAGFRPVRVFAGTSLLLTDGPKDVDPEGTQALVIITPSMGQSAIGPQQEGAVARKIFLAGLPQVNGLSIAREERTTRGGAVAVRIQGSAKDARTGRPLSVTQTMLFDGARYLRVVGIAGAGKPETLASLERIAGSVALR